MTKSRKWWIGSFVAVLVLAAAAPWLIPTATWKAPIEAAATEALGAPVTIGAVDVMLLPLPHATVRDIDVGKGALHLASAAIYPQLLSLFSSPRRLSRVELDKLVVSPAGVELLQAFAARPSSGPALVTVGEVHARGVAVTLASGPLPSLEAALELGADNLPRKLALSTSDGKAKLFAVPEGEGWKLDLVAKDWQLPLGPPLVFAEIKASGRVDTSHVDLPAISVRLYGGKVEGGADLAWGKLWRLNGKVAVSGLEIAPLLAALKLKASLAGKLDASGPFKSQAAKPDALAEAFNADIVFKVHDGVLHGFDLANAAKSLIKSGASGGQTRFDQLSGNVQVAGRALRLRNLRVASGAVDAAGNVDVSAARHLSGRVEVDLKGTGGLVGVPLAVSGTLADPVLMPTRGSMAGAAVGSVLLPGVGTAVGSSIGDKIGKLFGK